MGDYRNSLAGNLIAGATSVVVIVLTGVMIWNGGEVRLQARTGFVNLRVYSAWPGPGGSVFYGESL